MPLTESAKKHWFGNVEPQYRFDYSGPTGMMKYEGYASPGVPETTAGWVIIKHSFNSDNADIEGQPKYGLIWSLRTIYNYDSP